MLCLPCVDLSFTFARVSSTRGFAMSALAIRSLVFRAHFDPCRVSALALPLLMHLPSAESQMPCVPSS